MTMRRHFLIVTVAMLLMPIDGVPQVPRSAHPTGVVRSFYRFHLARDMNFTRRNVMRRKQWLSPALYRLLLNEFVREKEYGRSHPDESFVSYMEGDPFTSSQEFPTSFRIGNSLLTQNKADVKIIFLWSARSSRGRDQRNVQIELIKRNGRWLIDNVIDTDNGGNLVADLKREKYLP